jgi:hypothetical protein
MRIIMPMMMVMMVPTPTIIRAVPIAITIIRTIPRIINPWVVSP